MGAYDRKAARALSALLQLTRGKDGVVSRIKPILTPGAIVTDSRTAVHKIATEYGVVNLKGKNTWQRAEALISIAHPDFRDELIREAERMNIWKKKKSGINCG
jgi:acyl-CoA hydrolase